jgi:hypothetical protein
MKTNEHIRRLLEKFYEGQTSLEEEKELSAFFESGEVPSILLPDKQLFRSMQAASHPVEVPGDLESRLRSAIEAEESKDIKTRRINWFSLSGLAAGLAIILTVYLTVLRQTPQQYATGTFEDPQEAYEETLKVLSYVSGKWNSGTRELRNLQQVNKSLEAIRPIKKVQSGTMQLQLLGNLEKTKNL